MINKRHTKHARKRMQQRAISDTQVRLIEMFGEYRYQKGGCHLANIPEKILSELRSAVDKLSNVQAVFSESDELITVMHETRSTHKTDYAC
jgi:hypothetical protein